MIQIADGQTQLASGSPPRPRPHPLNRGAHALSAEGRLLAEAPQLCTLHRLLAHELPLQGERAYVMRRYLVARGIRPSMWRRLQQTGTDWLTEGLRHYVRGRKRRAQMAVDLLLVAQAFGTAALVPMWLLHAFMCLYGNPNRPRTSYHARLQGLYSLCALLGRWAASDRLEPLLKSNIHALLFWADTQWASGVGNTSRPPTLQSLLREAREHAEHERVSLLDAQDLNLPESIALSCALPGYQAILLRSPLELWEEGRTMRHCAAKFISPCAQKNYFVVSLRPVSGGRPIATVGMRKDMGMVLFDKVTGFANTVVSATVREVARGLAHQVGRQLFPVAARRA